jgi:hypothetical protein
VHYISETVEHLMICSDIYILLSDKRGGEKNNNETKSIAQINDGLIDFVINKGHT